MYLEPFIVRCPEVSSVDECSSYSHNERFGDYNYYGSPVRRNKRYVSNKKEDSNDHRDPKNTRSKREKELPFILQENEFQENIRRKNLKMSFIDEKNRQIVSELRKKRMIREAVLISNRIKRSDNLPALTRRSRTVFPSNSNPHPSDHYEGSPHFTAENDYHPHKPGKVGSYAKYSDVIVLKGDLLDSPAVVDNKYDNAHNYTANTNISPFPQTPSESSLTTPTAPYPIFTPFPVENAEAANQRQPSLGIFPNHELRGENRSQLQYGTIDQINSNHPISPTPRDFPYNNDTHAELLGDRIYHQEAENLNSSPMNLNDPHSTVHADYKNINENREFHPGTIDHQETGKYNEQYRTNADRPDIYAAGNFMSRMPNNYTRDRGVPIDSTTDYYYAGNLKPEDVRGDIKILMYIRK